MKRLTIYCFVVPLLSLICLGCMPRLASRPMTEQELEWANFIRPSYPSWRPPYYSPARVGGRYQPAITEGHAPVPEPRLEAPRAEPEGGEVELIPVEPQD